MNVNEQEVLAEVESLAKNMTSVVSFPRRCPLWGDGRFHGNCDGQLFLALALRYNAQYIADPMFGSGTTRDAVAWLNRMRGERRHYWGSDLREGFDVLSDELPGPFDFIWMHPPYWNMVRYSDHPSDLSTMHNFGKFMVQLTGSMQRCMNALAPGGRLAVLLGDVRRNGDYTSLPAHVAVFGYLAQLRAVVIKEQHACRSDQTAYRLSEPRIRHETCLIFQRR